MTDRVLIVFAKEPEKGQVKTRLEPYKGADYCLSLYKAFLIDTLEIARKVKCDKRILAYACNKRGIPVFIKKNSKGFELYRQRGASLGSRMNNAFKYAFKSGPAKAIIIGSDSPSLPYKFINKSFHLLDLNDIVIGPSNDGGYYLIGMKSPCNNIFKGIKWSTKNVFNETMVILRKLSKSAAILDKWFDVDDIESLNYLKSSLKSEPHLNIARKTRSIILG